MNRKKSGEFGWIAQIRERFASLVPVGAVGIGDDGAVIPTGGRLTIVTTDMLVEDVHFVRTAISPRDLGYKSLAVNLSDLAAMGAESAASFLSIGLPGDVDEAWKNSFLSGYQEISSEFDVPLLGGDTTAADKIVISVTALGTAPGERIKRRNGARLGDVVCVTGPLGDSAGGLLLQSQTPENEDEKRLIAAHHRPKPYVREGVWLGRQPAVHAMMDVSDGISSDLHHILEESGVAARIELDRLPISNALRRVAAAKGWDAGKLAVTGGEDYVLLLAVQPDAYDDLNQNYNSEFGTELFPVGEIATGDPWIEWQRGGKLQNIDYKGFEHEI